MKPQWKIVLDHLQKHGEIDSNYAYFKLKVPRLPLRIIDLRNKGYIIDSVFYDIKMPDGSTQHNHKYVYKGSSNPRSKEDSDEVNR